MDDTPINKAILESMIGEINDEELKSFVVIFQESTALDLERIKQAIANKDNNELIEASHSAKGAAASVGAEKISKILVTIHNNSQSNDWETLEEQCHILVREFELLDEYIKQL